MTKKSVLITIVLVFVLSLVVVVEALGADPNPVGWWKFDEGSGTTAENSGSFGSSHDGTLHNMTPSDWVGGVTGTSLDFDGSYDYVSIPALNLDSDTVTISAWIKRNGGQSGSDTGIVFSRDGSTVAGLCFGHDEGWNANHHLGYNWNDDQAAWDWDSGLFIPDNQWVFVALVVEPTKATLYIGKNRALFSATRVLVHDMEEFDGVTFIGSDGLWDWRFFKGSIDEVRIYNDALSSTEIAALYNSYLGPKASNPNPSNGATGIATDVVLSWDAGIDAVSHDVYFGTNYNDVVHATIAVPLGVYKGSQSSTSYIPTLAEDTTYYWRIDEVNESDVNSPLKGDVWSFKTWVEPNPVSWWRFDEGQGYTAYDSAGNNDGTVYGTQWAGGQIGGALEFDGEDDYIDVADSPGLDITDGITIGMWIKPYLGMDCDENNNWRYLLRKGEAGWGAYNLIYEASWDMPPIGFTVVTGSAYRLWTNRATYPDEFTYLAFTYDAETGEQKIYFNGNLDSQQITGGGFISNRSGPLRIGGGANTGCPDGAGFFKGLIDEVRIYDRALSAAKILQIYREGFRASNPNPADGAECVRPDVVLSWTPGKDAASHDVYFGTDFDGVKEAITSSSEYKGNQEQNSYEANGLKFGETYYWRIDEVNESDVNSPWKGDVWSFTTRQMSTDQGEVIILSHAEKICQLVGDWDRERREPTINLTGQSYNMPATDLGVPFRHKDRTYIVFGDVFFRDEDPIAYTTDASPEDCLELTFLHNGSDPDGYGPYRPIQIPGVSLGAYEVPMEGVSIDGNMYIYATTDHSWSATMGRSVVAVSYDDGYTFEYLYDLSTEYFINVSIVEAELSNSDGLPSSDGIGLVMFGSGTYRESNVRLAFQPAEEVESPTSICYFSGFGDNGEPVWSSNESDAVELFDQPCVGELSVTYNQFIKKWILLYNCCCPRWQRGINVRTADNPWGPWSEYQVVFEPWDDGGYCHFIHTNWNFRRCDRVYDPGREYEWGGEYGPYQFEDLAVGDCSTTTIYFTMSTWNPYTVILMSTMLGRVTEEPPVITLNGSAIVVLECGMDSYTEEGATAANLCDPDVPVVIGGDTVDTSECGTYVVTYDATDDSGNSAAQVTRMVIVEDTIPPEFSLAAEPNELWPPNHKMVLITVEWEVSDNCDDEPEVRLVSITSSEDDDGKGDGAKSDDIVIGEDGSIYLRAERVGYLGGRVYTITYEAVDDSGNATVRSAEVVVPGGHRWRHREHRGGNREHRGGR